MRSASKLEVFLNLTLRHGAGSDHEGIASHRLITVVWLPHLLIILIMESTRKILSVASMLRTDQYYEYNYVDTSTYSKYHSARNIKNVVIV
jgi:hypothetical protein